MDTKKKEKKEKNLSDAGLDFMLPYAKLAWQANIDNCPISE